MSKDGGPAFPGASPDRDYYSWGGMSLRDYFAAAASMGMMARDTFDAGQASPAQRARLAYLEADAMLAERDKGTGC